MVVMYIWKYVSADGVNRSEKCGCAITFVWVKSVMLRRPQSSRPRPRPRPIKTKTVADKTYIRT